MIPNDEEIRYDMAVRYNRAALMILDIFKVKIMSVLVNCDLNMHLSRPHILKL